MTLDNKIDPPNSIEIIGGIDGLRNVGRWNGFFAFDRSNVLEHSMRAVWWSRLLIDKLMECDDKRYALPEVSCLIRTICYEYLMDHDFAEKYTGDVPHSTKVRFPDLKKALLEVDEVINSEKLPKPLKIPELLFRKVDYYLEDITYLICKISDVLDFTYEAMKEIVKGNDEVEYRNAINRGATILHGLKHKDNPLLKVIISNGEHMFDSILHHYNNIIKSNHRRIV